MVKVKRVYDAQSSADGKRILVDRLWPRGLKKEAGKVDEWLKDIAPSNELRKWFAHDPSKWSEFKERYYRELKEKEHLIEALARRTKKETITLAFSAKDAEHNNAVALKELLNGREKR